MQLHFEEEGARSQMCFRNLQKSQARFKMRLDHWWSNGRFGRKSNHLASIPAMSRQTAIDHFRREPPFTGEVPRTYPRVTSGAVDVPKPYGNREALGHGHPGRRVSDCQLVLRKHQPWCAWGKLYGWMENHPLPPPHRRKPEKRLCELRAAQPWR